MSARKFLINAIVLAEPINSWIVGKPQACFLKAPSTV